MMIREDGMGQQCGNGERMREKWQEGELKITRISEEKLKISTDSDMLDC